MDLEKEYIRSLNILKSYFKIYNKIPNEKTWNKVALKNDCLSSKTIQYLSGMRFNRLCRNLIKEVNKEKRHK